MSQRQLSPIFHPPYSHHHKTTPFLSEIQQNAQQSINERLKLKLISHTDSSTLQNFKLKPHPPKKSLRQSKRVIIRTKQPSLPYVPQDNNTFYDKWYIPYDQRYIHPPKCQQQSNLEDELHFYKNINTLEKQFDPFSNQMPQDIKQSIQMKQRSDALKEMFKGSRVIIDFKKQLEKQQTRVPHFVKKILEEKS